MGSAVRIRSANQLIFLLGVCLPYICSIIKWMICGSSHAHSGATSSSVGLTLQLLSEELVLIFFHHLIYERLIHFFFHHDGSLLPVLIPRGVTSIC